MHGNGGATAPDMISNANNASRRSTGIKTINRRKAGTEATKQHHVVTPALVDFTVEIERYTERIEQIYRHYTSNDLNTLGMNGFLRFLKDLNLLKPPKNKSYRMN